MKSTFSYPEWDEIPNIDLYLDQVLLYVNKVCSPISLAKEKGLTASMVNNYVKHGYISKPEKKKYQRKQIARLIAITTLKSVFSIQEIAQTLNTLHTETNSQELYNAFVDYMNEDTTKGLFCHLTCFNIFNHNRFHTVFTLDFFNDRIPNEVDFFIGKGTIL